MPFSTNGETSVETVRLRDWSNGVKIRMLMFSVAEILAGINRKVAGWFLAGLALLRKS